ncbi:N-acetyl-gamma-glutamyl-phosphate reductase [Candidatus Sumerlaeota bacterium]|nr:N-acetyl-gamma-glutamyl-phosphate reductase [Candidatus Sumerlaeota bacterium]
MAEKIQASIIGASGYAGGELLRLLLDHPHVEVKQATSEQHQTKFVHAIHPNLRGRTQLKFVSAAQIEECDFLFVSLPHGSASSKMPELVKLAPKVIDLSADHRLRDVAAYEQWYGEPHPHPDINAQFVYGVPEVNREALREAKWASGAGCNGTATQLGLLPFKRAGVEIVSALADIKAGSSESGNKPNLGSHHPERSGCVRSFAPTGHRHTAEVQQTMGWTRDDARIQMSVTAIEMVRGVLATIHVQPKEKLEEKDLWKIFRGAYKDEPFVRIVKDRQGIYRFPEPKILSGSNYCDVGFDVDPQTGRVVVISAIDNLMKGAAGNCVQAMNVMMGWNESAGLGFPGLHPV